MSDEQIKDIVIAVINKGAFYTGDDNEDTAKEITLFINTLKTETFKWRAPKDPLGEQLTTEEIAKRAGLPPEGTADVETEWIE